MQKHDRVEVRWRDTTSKHGWQPTDDLPEPAEITSLGFLVKSNRDHIVLAQDWDRETSGETYGCLTAIPRKTIRSVRRLAPRKK